MGEGKQRGRGGSDGAKRMGKTFIGGEGQLARSLGNIPGMIPEQNSTPTTPINTPNKGLPRDRRGYLGG